MMRKGLVKIVLAAVPEQVNIPILICKERGIFEKYGVDPVHRIVPEGTGKMLDLLETSDVDVALTVTDGFIAGRAKGRKVQLLGTFVESPLIWAIAGSPLSGHSDSASNLGLSRLASLDSVRVGISRVGSGSHTMAQYLLCGQLGVPLEKVRFEVVNDLTGLRNGIATGSCDCFLWEKFTTKPLFDSGELCMLGEVPTPWTAFSFVCSERMFSRDTDDLCGGSGERLPGELAAAVREGLFPALAEGVRIFTGEMAMTAPGKENIASPMIQRICKDHGHKPQDAALWLKSIRYAVPSTTPIVVEAATGTVNPPFAVDRQRTERSLNLLQQVGLTPTGFTVDALVGENNSVVNFY